MHGLLDMFINKHVIICLIFVIINIILLFNKKISDKGLKILNIIPIALGIIHYIFFNFKGNPDLTLSYFDTIYMTSLGFLVILFFIKQKKVYNLLIILFLPICLMDFLLTGVNMTRYYSIHNFSYYSYTNSFKKMMNTLKKEYVLNDWKKIDYDQLEKEYLPLIEEAEKNKDESLFYETVFKFVNEIQDGHFGAHCLNRACLETMSKYDINNYYGFDTVLLDDGRIIAIKVDPESDAYQKGLRDYYTIIARDNIDILKYLDDYFYHTNGEPVEYNQRLINSTKIFYRGEDKTSITYLDKKNNQKTIEVENMNKGSDCFYHTLLSYRRVDHYYTEMLTDDIGYLNLNTEYTNRLKNLFSYLTGDSSYAKQPIIDNLNKLKEQGMKKLIIDLRGNLGGYFHISGAYTEPFTDESFTYSKAKRITGYDEYKIKGSGEFKDIPIVVLTNANTGSAGDTLLEIYSRNPNVTIIGLMPSNNSSQEVGGQIYLTNTSINIFYPRFNSVTEDNKIYIDPDDSRIENLKLDIKIEINEDTIEKLINNDDYVLDYAIKYIQEK